MNNMFRAAGAILVLGVTYGVTFATTFYATDKTFHWLDSGGPGRVIDRVKSAMPKRKRPMASVSAIN